MLKHAALLAPLAALTSAASPDPLEGRAPGPPVDCVTLSRGTGPTIVDRRTILYRESGRRIWRTGPLGACPALRPMAMLIIEVQGAQLCRNDRFRVQEVGSSIPSAICRLDRFTPYDKVRR